MRERHFPRLCRSCQAPMARQEDTCWQCGARWASEDAGEVVASMRELRRPEAGQHVAVTAVGRAFSRSRSRSSARRRSVSRSSDSSS
jgi:predicted amidophosphoribosyltransferase